MTDRELQLKAVHLRKKTLEAIFEAGAGHTGGGLSCLDILNVLYNRVLNVSRRIFPVRIATATCKARAIPWRPFTPCWRIADFFRKRI